MRVVMTLNLSILPERGLINLQVEFCHHIRLRTRPAEHLAFS